MAMKKTNLIILLLLVLLCVPPVFAADYYTGSSVQDMGISWEPESADALQGIVISTDGILDDISSLTFNMTKVLGVTIYNTSNLLLINFPNLTNVLLIEIEGNPDLTEVSLPLLEADVGSEGNGMSISNNASLVTIELTNFTPANTLAYDFSLNALSAATVNAILARFVANAAYVTGRLYLSGGTNSAPTGQGLTDVTTLRARGVTVTVSGE